MCFIPVGPQRPFAPAELLLVALALDIRTHHEKMALGGQCTAILHVMQRTYVLHLGELYT